jgi:predicted SAM-dependent methyltransferase
MRDRVRNILKRLYIDDLARELWHTTNRILVTFKRKFGRLDRELIDKYVSTEEIRKLHIGCGEKTIDGWLNADFFPWSPTVLHLDATKRFPIGDQQFDYVFSEHMIEHIPYPQGFLMLSECYRTLREGGTIRITTPNLAFLINLYRDNKSDVQKEYIKFATDGFIKYAPCADSTFVINNFVRDWGHQFIYDEKTLRAAMERAGFKKVTRRELNESDAVALRALEDTNRMPERFLRLESFILEGTKLTAV